MELELLLEKCIHIIFHDGSEFEGFLIDVNSIDNYEDMIFYKTLTVKDYSDEYQVFYLNEIESIEEVK